MREEIAALARLADAPERRIIGLMSGTSLDGLDIALCRVRRSGFETEVDLERFTTTPYDGAYRARVRSVFSKRTVDLEEVCLLNPHVAEVHAQFILDALDQWGVRPSDVDMIASHGQTVYHAPKSLHGRPEGGDATLQLGDGDHLAVRTGVMTLSDFRQKHIAAGGEGAPLAAYGDALLLGDRMEDRVFLNIGGIANLTWAPARAKDETPFSTDIGPGNTLLDGFMQSLDPDTLYDADGALARQGVVSAPVLEALRGSAFFSAPFPKTTGPELFNQDYVRHAVARARDRGLNREPSAADVMATLVEFSAVEIAGAVEALAPAAARVYASGGGVHNPVLMARIAHHLGARPLGTTDDLHLNPDAKEAVLFAILANETLAGAQGGGLNGHAAKMPDITMGKLSFPR